MANVAPVINLPGNLDILATSYANNVVWDLFGDGTGKFAFATPSSISVGTNPTVVAPGDINNDGRLDFVTVNAGSGTVSVMLGNGAGGFTAAAGSPITVGGADGQSIALGDVNGDGNLDIVSSNTDAGTLSVLLGNGTGGFYRGGVAICGGDRTAIGRACRCQRRRQARHRHGKLDQQQRQHIVAQCRRGVHLDGAHLCQRRTLLCRAGRYER